MLLEALRFDEGEPISAEGNLLRAADLDGDRDWDAFDLADEETVISVATEWSINPTTLEERDDLPPFGIWASHRRTLTPRAKCQIRTELALRPTTIFPAATRAETLAGLRVVDPHVRHGDRERFPCPRRRLRTISA